MVQGLLRGMDRRSRRWMCRIAALVLVAVVATALPAAMQTALAASEAGTELETMRFGRGDTLSALLGEAGVSAVDADGISKAIQRKTNLRRMRVGHEVRLLFRVENEHRTVPLAISVQTGPGRFVEATRTAKGSYRARRTNLPLSRPIPLSEVALDLDGRTVTVRRNETIGGILHRHGVDGETVEAVVNALRTEFDPRYLMPGHAISIAAGYDGDGASILRGLALHLEDDAAVAVVRTDSGGYTAQRTTGAALQVAGVESAARVAVAEAAVPRQKPTGEGDATALSKADPPQGEAPPDQAVAEGAAPDPGPELIELRRTLRAGSNLMDLLLDAEVRRPEADALVQSLRRVFNPRRLPAGIAVRVTKRPIPGFEPRIARLDIDLPRGKRIEVERGEKGRFVSRITKAPPTRPLTAKPVAPVVDKPPATVAAAPTPDPAGDPEVASPTPPTMAAATAPAPAPDPVLASAELVTVRSGDTLMAILRRHGIDRVEADRAIQAARSLFNLRRLRIGQEITLVTGTDKTGADTLQAVALRVADDHFVKVTRAVGGDFEAERVSQLALTGAPLQRLATSVTPADDGEADQRVEQAAGDGRGQVMDSAFVAAAAPLPAAIADLTDGIVNGVNGTASALVDVDDGLVHKAVVLRKGDTLSAALTRAGGTREETEAAIVAFRKVHNPRRLRIGQTLSLAFDTLNGSNGKARLASVVLDVAPDRDVVVTRGDDDIFVPEVVDRPLERVLQRNVGSIKTNLHDAALGADMPLQVLAELVHIFSFDVDFQRDMQPGNRFEVLYEAAYDEAGEFVENGPLLYALLEAGERSIELFRYEPDEGPADYLDARGESVRKALMRTPINGARLSSGYGMRKHPILGYNKKHLGLDFAAPIGTPIFAAGDGTISMIGRYGNYGKYIRIRHNSTYNTGYAHLSGYAKGMKTGKRVRQGQVIGYVGSTGMSTGPHLHYEIMRGNTRINPMTLKLPAGRKLKGHELAAFHKQVQKITILLAEVPALTTVAQR